MRNSISFIVLSAVQNRTGNFSTKHMIFTRPTTCTNLLPIVDFATWLALVLVLDLVVVRSSLQVFHRLAVLLFRHLFEDTFGRCPEVEVTGAHACNQSFREFDTPCFCERITYHSTRVYPSRLVMLLLVMESFGLPSGYSQRYSRNASRSISRRLSSHPCATGFMR